MKRQGNMIPQNVNNHITKALMDIEMDEASISKLKRMITIIINEMKMCKNKSMESKKI
jgi:hypothetical protein